MRRTMPRYYGDKDLFSYRGYIYCPEDDVEEDNIKRFHHVYCELDGIRVWVCDVPLSPYDTLDKQTFERWIQMGKPSREKMGGHHKENHIRYWRKLFDEALDKILLG